MKLFVIGFALAASAPVLAAKKTVIVKGETAQTVASKRQKPFGGTLTEIIDPGNYRSTKIECLDANGQQVGFPVEQVDLSIYDSGRIRVRTYRAKSGYTIDETGSVFYEPVKGSKSKFSIQQWNYGGLECMLTGCKQRVGLLEINERANVFKINFDVYEICKSSEAKIESVTLSLVPVEDPDAVPPITSKPSTHPEDNYPPFFHFARYPNGAMIWMSYDSAIKYCKNPNFVEQPAHLASIEDISGYVQKHGGKGIIASEVREKSGDWRGKPWAQFYRLPDESNSELVEVFQYSTEGYQPDPNAPNNRVWVKALPARFMNPVVFYFGEYYDFVGGPGQITYNYGNTKAADLLKIAPVGCVRGE